MPRHGWGTHFYTDSSISPETNFGNLVFQAFALHWPRHACFLFQRGGGMRTVLARQERMGPQAMGWSDLSRQTSMAVRKLFPQLIAMLLEDSPGLALVKREMISSGGMEVCEERLLSVGGITRDL